MNRHPFSALLLAALCLPGLSSCILQSALHRPVFDWGREGSGLLVKGRSDVLKIGSEWEAVLHSVTVYRADGRMFIEAYPTDYVRRNRAWLLTLEDDHPRYEARPTDAPVVYGEVVKDASGYLVRTYTPWQDSLPPGAVHQTGKLLLSTDRRHLCGQGAVLVLTDLQAGPHALWAYPLGTVLAVADMPLTVALHGIAAVAIPVVSTYDQLSGRPYPRNQEPPVRHDARTEQED
ncbi:MAG: hypothetical protein IJE66_08100 [Akkermansia sp.]|nr:hypothetical protein [Akkermansia sp.]